MTFCPAIAHATPTCLSRPDAICSKRVGFSPLECNPLPKLGFSYLPAVGSAARKSKKSAYMYARPLTEVHTMPAVCPRVPKYCLHKARGLAYVRDRGKVLYLGKHGSPESKEAYTRFLIEWEARLAGAPPPLPEPGLDLTVVELCAAYWDFAQRYYTKNGEPGGWLTHIRLMLRKVREAYGHTPASEFGPRKLKTIRQALIDAGHSRVYINKLIPIVLRMFKWATAEELLPGNVYQALRSVEGLRKGRTAARETKAVPPVPDDVVDATLPHLPPSSRWARSSSALCRLARGRDTSMSAG